MGWKYDYVSISYKFFHVKIRPLWDGNTCFWRNIFCNLVPVVLKSDHLQAKGINRKNSEGILNCGIFL
ncbi:hypothetical protein KKP97_06450 [Methanothermococcus sp. SCGC AD-155-C09]|nr:hypothetical protein [Methanothermococcus sp. SCGC AD-155-C09]